MDLASRADGLQLEVRYGISLYLQKWDISHAMKTIEGLGGKVVYPLEILGRRKRGFSRGSTNRHIRLPNGDAPCLRQQRCHGGVFTGAQALQSESARGSSYAKGGGTDQVLCRIVSRSVSQSRHQVTSHLENDGDSMKPRSRT